MPKATQADIERKRDRIREAAAAGDITPEECDNLLKCSTVMGRHQTGKRGWGHDRHDSVLQRLIMLAWGGDKYDRDEMHDTTLSAALDDKEAAGMIVEWIHATYENEETNRDMRNALRTFGKVLTNEDSIDKDAAPPPSIDWIPSNTPDNYEPLPNPKNMITWEETKAMCDHPQINARDAALIAVAWDAGPRSGELQELTVDDVFDHDVGKKLRIQDGKTGTRHPTITNAVPYLRQWLNQHPATDSSGGPDDPTAPLWSKLKKPDGISYRMYRNIFKDAAERVGLNKPNDPTNFRKSSASACASGA